MWFSFTIGIEQFQLLLMTRLNMIDRPLTSELIINIIYTHKMVVYLKFIIIFKTIL
jgi:hypothetical protein